MTSTRASVPNLDLPYVDLFAEDVIDRYATLASIGSVVADELGQLRWRSDDRVVGRAFRSRAIWCHVLSAQAHLGLEPDDPEVFSAGLIRRLHESAPDTASGQAFRVDTVPVLWEVNAIVMFVLRSDVGPLMGAYLVGDVPLEELLAGLEQVGGGW